MARIKEGELFKSFHKFENALAAYEKQNGDELKRTNSKTLLNCYRNGIKRNLVAEGYKAKLKYAEVIYKCPLNTTKGNKKRDNGSQCPVELRLIANDDKKHLIIKKFIGAHNHTMHPTCKENDNQNSEMQTGQENEKHHEDSTQNQTQFSNNEAINAVVEKLSKYLSTLIADTLPAKLESINALIQGWREGLSMTVHEISEPDLRNIVDTEKSKKVSASNHKGIQKDSNVNDPCAASDQLIDVASNGSTTNPDNIDETLEVTFGSLQSSRLHRSGGEKEPKRRKIRLQNIPNDEVSNSLLHNVDITKAVNSMSDLEVDSESPNTKDNEPQHAMQVDWVKSKTTEPSASLSDTNEKESIPKSSSQKILRSRGRPRGPKTTAVLGFPKSMKVPLKFSQKSEIAQAREMMRWLKIPDDTLELALQRKHEITKVDLNYDPKNLRDSFIDPTVKIGILDQYFERRAFRDLKKAVKEKIENEKDLAISTCNICCNEIEGKAIFCEGCLVWNDYTCASIKRAPSKKTDWFCVTCTKSV